MCKSSIILFIQADLLLLPKVWPISGMPPFQRLRTSSSIDRSRSFGLRSAAHRAVYPRCVATPCAAMRCEMLSTERQPVMMRERISTTYANRTKRRTIFAALTARIEQRIVCVGNTCCFALVI